MHELERAGFRAAAMNASLPSMRPLVPAGMSTSVWKSSGARVALATDAVSRAVGGSVNELIRTGNLDFALLKPIDTQFLISCEKMELAMVNQTLLASSLLIYSLVVIGQPVSVTQVAIYLLFIVVGVAFFK